MKSRIACAAVAVALMLGSASFALAQDAIAVKPATIWYADQFTVHSESLKRDFLIQVAKPVKPQAGKTPVIYVLDGNSMFGEVADMMIGYGYFGETAAAYVVGIGYPDQDYNQWLSLRNHDLLYGPLPDAFKQVSDSLKIAPGSAEGAGFQKFLLQELRPLIERRYPVDPHRSTLAGHSFSGLFALHLMLTSPGAFDEYLICSPSIWAEPQLLDAASAFHATAPLNAFIGVGAKEEEQFTGMHMVRNARELSARLSNHASGVEPTFIDFDGRTHGTVIPECLSRGLLALLPAPPATTSH